MGKGRDMAEIKKKKKMVFFCQNCGYESAKWMGQCPGCREWNTFVEEPVPAKAESKGRAAGAGGSTAKPVPLSEIAVQKEDRMSTDIEELDRVLGGGIVPGVPSDVRQGNSGPLYFRRGISAPDQAPRSADRRFYGENAPSV